MNDPAAQETRAGSRAVVGLGNPGERYRDTRHNLGFRAVEELARRLGVGLDGFECTARVGWRGEDLVLALPRTYMNRSGYAVRCLAERHDLEPSAILVVYDEVALPLGRLRLRPGGSPGGHRGMESVVEGLRTDRIPRLRLGCGGEDGPPAAEDLVGYVLSPFRPEEREAADAMVERAADACRAWLEDGVEAAMNEFNG